MYLVKVDVWLASAVSGLTSAGQPSEPSSFTVRSRALPIYLIVLHTYLVVCIDASTAWTTYIHTYITS